MRDVWQRIENLLHNQAPDLLARLAAGASPEAITKTEAKLGYQLPDEVRESYAIHDGSGNAGIFPQDDYGRINGVSLLSLEDATHESQSWTKLLNRNEFVGNTAHPTGPIKAEWWNRNWFPLTSNGGGDHLCIDMDPAPGGTIGQVIDFSHESGPRAVLAPSWRAFLNNYVSDLEAGRLRFDDTGELASTTEE